MGANEKDRRADDIKAWIQSVADTSERDQCDIEPPAKRRRCKTEIDESRTFTSPYQTAMPNTPPSTTSISNTSNKKRSADELEDDVIRLAGLDLTPRTARFTAAFSQHTLSPIKRARSTSPRKATNQKKNLEGMEELEKPIFIEQL